jgi:phenylalanyl-tRNA synthetase beta chain
VKDILESLGFETLEETDAQLRLAAPYSKPDISLPADVVEEIMRIDGYDNIGIPSHITIAPSLSEQPDRQAVREKTAAYLSANGFHEIFTNSITNSRYYDSAPAKEHLVHMLNNLSAELDVMRPSMLESGLESVAYNLNRKQADLFFFEFGKTYRQAAPYEYEEKEHLCLYLTGNKRPESWITKAEKIDGFFLKGHLQNVLLQLGLSAFQFSAAEDSSLTGAQDILYGRQRVGLFGRVAEEKLQRFGIRQPVWFADLDWHAIVNLSSRTQIRFTGIPRFPSVRRDLALILSKGVQFADVERVVRSVKVPILQEIDLFDVFESDKLGAGKKSYAVSFTFRHPEKTLTDKETDKAVQSLITALEKQLQAEIRK